MSYLSNWLSRANSSDKDRLDMVNKSDQNNLQDMSWGSRWNRKIHYCYSPENRPHTSWAHPKKGHLNRLLLRKDHPDDNCNNQPHTKWYNQELVHSWSHWDRNTSSGRLVVAVMMVHKYKWDKFLVNKSAVSDTADRSNIDQR